MKKRKMLFAGILAAALLAAGCGKKDEVVPQVPVTATPTPESAKKNDSELVDMQQSVKEEEEFKNVLGTKTAASSKFVLVNKTGEDIESVFIRVHPEEDDDQWGEDLVNGKFVLKDGEKAVCYYEKGSAKSYDIRIIYRDSDRYQNYFRSLPFSVITQLTLRIDGKGDAELPFATYLSAGSKREISTLNEVKKRLGLLDNEGDSPNTDSAQDEETADNSGNNGNNGDSGNQNPNQDPNNGTQTPDPGNNGGDDGEDGPNSTISSVEDYIGKSFDDLCGTFGDPSGSDYQDEPETGKTGYHYYYVDGTAFTVSTTVDENGNEIVAGVW